VSRNTYARLSPVIGFGALVTFPASLTPKNPPAISSAEWALFVEHEKEYKLAWRESFLR
jgi:hypothetical protein